MAAVAAALGSSYKEGSDKVMPLPIAGGGRRTTSAAARAARASAASVLGTSLPSPPASLPSSKFVSSEAQREMMQGSAIDDSNDLSGEEPYADFQKNRTRRASDGLSLVKEGRKFNRVELRCDKCGKSYKHSSCLTKHLFVSLPGLHQTPTDRGIGSREAAVFVGPMPGLAHLLT